MLKIRLLNKKISVIIVLVFLLICCLCGCNDDVETGDETSAIVFTDALGRTVELESEPDRVAALIGSFADVWQLAGGEVCATAEDAWDDFDLELNSCVNIGGAHSPGLEKLLSANPDFVIASASTASNVKLKDSLENAGITVAYFDVDSFGDYLQMLKVCTDITGRKDLYEKNGIGIKKQIDTIVEEFNSSDVSEAERTVLLLRASSGSVKAKGSDGTILGEMLKDLGCVNIADSDKTLLDSLSVENIINQQPYHIFVVSMGDDKKATENLNKMFEDNPAWSGLDAVMEKRFHVMERKLFNIKPNADWAKSYEILSEILLGK